LEFNGSPLAEAVATINRYSRVQLRLVGAEAGKVELSGVLRADNIEPLLTMLEGHYGLSVVRAGNIVMLSVSAPPER
jgi:transmembrane sensor